MLVADSRIVLPATGPNSRKTVVSWTNVDAERQHVAVAGSIAVPNCCLLVLLGQRPAAPGSLYCSRQVHVAAGQLDARVAVERIDREHRAAALSVRRRDREVAAR